MSQSSTYGPGGSGGTAIIQINGDTGIATGPIITFDAYPDSGQSVSFNASGSTVSFVTTDSIGNTLIGLGSGDSGITGTNNTALGKESLNTISTGSSNISIGYQSMNSTTNGSSNIVIGGGGANTINLGNGNIIIGSPLAPTAGVSNNIVIGNSTSTECYISGIDGVNVGLVAKVLTMSADHIGTATITAGTGISVTPTANTITVAATGIGSFSWSVITADQSALVNRGYICNKSGTLALALPAVASVGDTIKVTGINTALGWQITQAVGQAIRIGASTTTTGVSGSLASSAIRDSIEMICIVANSTWQVVSCLGNITVV